MPFTSFINRFFTRSFALSSPKMSIAPQGANGAATSAALPDGAQLCT
ncbi:hypothetical protein MY5147_009671, partial [Beauveria neobassiana]